MEHPIEAASRVVELKAVLDGLADQVEHEPETSAAEHRLFADAIANLRAQGPELLVRAAPFLWEYYRLIAAEFTTAQRAAYGIPEIAPDEDIWAHVSFRHPPEPRAGHGPLAPGPSYLSFEGEVSWEPEHGLQLVIEHGLRVCKVGPYDGHVTVAHARDDVSLLGVIFAG